MKCLSINSKDIWKVNTRFLATLQAHFQSKKQYCNYQLESGTLPPSGHGLPPRKMYTNQSVAKTNGAKTPPSFLCASYLFCSLGVQKWLINQGLFIQTVLQTETHIWSVHSKSKLNVCWNMSILEQQCNLWIVTIFLCVRVGKKIHQYTKHENWQQLEQNVIANHENRHEAAKFLVTLFFCIVWF